MRDGNKRFSEVICSSEYADKSIAIKELVRILLNIFLCSFKLWINIQMLIYGVNVLFQHYFLAADNGGGMTPDKMRQCMSLGYSAKSKIANTIGQCELLNYFQMLLLQKFSGYIIGH